MSPLLPLLLRPILVIGLGTFAHGLTYNVEQHCYQDLLVGVSPDLQEDSWPQVKGGLEAWVTAGSSALFTATEGWAYICSVKVLLPAAWTVTPDSVAVNEVYTDAQVRVWNTDSLHGDSPFTEQPGECGEEGDYIQVSENFLAAENSSALPGFGFLQQWARLRYGVFEEHGYPGDQRYPTFYTQQIWTSNGPEVSVMPALCTDLRVEGTMKDRGGGSCSYDGSTGLPDSNCQFTVTGPSNLESSAMALPQLRDIDHFCKDTESHLHNPLLANRHNELCNTKSVWTVILEHPDFANFAALPGESSPAPTFTYIKPPTSQKFVIVLDVSNSMQWPNDPVTPQQRLPRAKRAASRFLTYDVDNGIPLGLVTFSQGANTVVDVAPVTNESRASTIETIGNLTVSQNTCIGKGLRKGLEALKNYDSAYGGVMIFLTDGEYYCPDSGHPEAGDWSSFNNDLAAIKDQNVRVITIAFSNNADNKIETLAVETGGASFFVPDNSGPSDLNNAFSGALAYQPEGPLAEKSVAIVEKTFLKQKNISVEFTIDNFVSRALLLQIDFDAEGTVTISLDGEETKFNAAEEVYRVTPLLDLGLHNLSITSPSAMAAVSLKVEGKAPVDSLPLTVDTWTSVGEGDLNLTAGMQLVLLAKVMQGGTPVVGANVTAFVARDDGGQVVEVELQDNGLGADRVAGDGLYAKYFIEFLSSPDSKRYGLRCEVTGTNETKVHHGQNNSMREVDNTPSCCGSSAVGPDSNLQPTGSFVRAQAGGLISVLPISEEALNNLYPPLKVSDLSVGSMDFTNSTFEIKFTWPGKQLDIGTVADYKVFYTTNVSLIQQPGKLVEGGQLLNLTNDQIEGEPGLPSPKEAGQGETILVRMDDFPKDSVIYWRVQADATNAADSKFSLSNLVNLYLVDVNQPRVEAGLSWGAAIGIFLGAFAAALLVGAAIFWHRRRYGGTLTKTIS